MQKTILILTQEIESTCQARRRSLQHRNTQIIRFDLGDLPERLMLAACIGTHSWQATITQAHHTYALEWNPERLV